MITFSKHSEVISLCISSQTQQYHHLCSLCYFFRNETLGYSTPQAYITSRRDGDVFDQRLCSPNHTTAGVAEDLVFELLI